MGRVERVVMSESIMGIVCFLLWSQDAPVSLRRDSDGYTMTARTPQISGWTNARAHKAEVGLRKLAKQIGVEIRTFSSRTDFRWGAAYLPDKRVVMICRRPAWTQQCLFVYSLAHELGHAVVWDSYSTGERERQIRARRAFDDQAMTRNDVASLLSDERAADIAAYALLLDAGVDFSVGDFDRLSASNTWAYLIFIATLNENRYLSLNTAYFISCPASIGIGD